ncbi:pyridoxal phosphate-dependent aminotransferase [Myxococcota bacterium]|nr:pyridoxal phosphate-dependent aminotransferase [Myxococcota bacterium]
MRLTRRSTRIVPPATLALAERGRQLAAEGRDVISLTTGEPDFSPPPHVVAAMKDALDAGHTRYTAVAGIPELRAAIARFYEARGHRYDPAEVIVSTGAKQSIHNAVLATIEDGDEAVIVAPYWLSYVDMVRLAGGQPVIVETREDEGFVVRASALADAITDKTRLVFLNSPSNPAGAVLSRDDLGAIAEVLRRHPQLTIISDEIYDCFVYGGREAPSILDVAPDLADRTLLVNGCSKRYAMTGLRIGWAAGPRTLISAMARLQGQATSNPNTISQLGALAALTGDQSFVSTMFDAFDTRRRFVVGRLGAIPGLTCFDPRGAFYVLPSVAGLVGRRLPDGTEIQDAVSVTAYLLHEHSLVVIPGGPFGAPSHFRISFATDLDTLAKGLERLRVALTALR